MASNTFYLWMALFSVPFFASVIMGFCITRSRDLVFGKNYKVSSSDSDHIKFNQNRTLVQLRLDNISGSGFISKHSYTYGYFSMKMKLNPGDSAGTVTTFYLSSNSIDAHDELDLEFLGNRSGQPYLLQTNVYTHGKGDKEERIALWFDPATKFHLYSILWNEHLVVFLVDDVPIRVFKNSTRVQAFPTKLPMKIQCTLWNGDDWATRGGLEKIDWSKAPFKAMYAGFNIDGCKGKNNSCKARWNSKEFQDLDPIQYEQLHWVRDKYMRYDYCNDPGRFNTTPPECPIIGGN